VLLISYLPNTVFDCYKWGMSHDDIPLLCAYCGQAMRFLGAEPAAVEPPMIRHYYNCPHCGQVWLMTPAGKLEAFDPILPDLPKVSPGDEAG
jgi:DNA-directed RNA polymerase subunit RPC12/RpoP